MSRTHTHVCEVPNCTRPVECDGYPVGSFYERDRHCVCAESGVFLCEDHAAYVYCGGCGNYVPAVNADNECPECAAETAWAATLPPIDEDPIPFDEAWPARPVSV